MKKIAFVFCLISVLISCKPKESSKEDVESVVKNLYSSFQKVDIDGLSEFLTPTFTGFENGDSFADAKSFVDLVKSMNLVSSTFDLNFIRTTISGENAFTEVSAVGNIITKDSKLDVKMHETYFLKKVNDKWLIDFYHSTHLSNGLPLVTGNMIGFHVVKTIKLMPGVTKEQAEEFMVNKYIPEFNKASTDFKIMAMKGLRGAEKDQLGLMYYFPTEENRNQLWDSEGTYSKKGEEYFKKFESLNAEAAKLYTIESTVYTDWLVK